MYIMEARLYSFLFSALLSLINLCLYGQDVKYASDYGFSVNATGEENSDALQKAFDGGGKIIVDGKGLYDISKSILIDSNTELVFEDGVVLNKCRNKNGEIMSYMFINRHAFDRIYDEDIYIKGLNIRMNGLDNGNDIGRIQGLCGIVSFFYIKNLVIEDFESVGGGCADFTIQICTFDSVRIENVHIEGLKDGIHFGRGKNFIVRNGKFKTYDDPIALNAHDYHISNPELGWIENGLIENCYDLDDSSTTGFFCRILAGAWPEWKYGMMFQNSDAVISNGKIYRLSTSSGKSLVKSTSKPVHEKGRKTYEDGLTWVMIQNKDIVDNCGVRNVRFKDIYLQKERSCAFSFHFDNDHFSRSYYPDCPVPVQTGIVLENIFQQNYITKFINCITPVDTIRIVNSELYDSSVHMNDVKIDGCDYGTQYVVFDNVLFKSSRKEYRVLKNRDNLDVKVEFINCKKNNPKSDLTVDNNIDIVSFDVSEIVDSSVENIKVYSQNGIICIYSTEDMHMEVYSLDGFSIRKIKIYKGMNKFYGFDDGLYIVSRSNFIL